MTSNHLAPAQASQLNATLRPMLAYLVKLKNRMEETGFPLDDKLYRAVTMAYDGLHAASVETHYLSVGKGVGRPSSPSWRDRMNGQTENRPEDRI